MHSISCKSRALNGEALDVFSPLFTFMCSVRVRALTLMRACLRVKLSSTFWLIFKIVTILTSSFHFGSLFCRNKVWWTRLSLVDTESAFAGGASMSELRKRIKGGACAACMISEQHQLHYMLSDNQRFSPGEAIELGGGGRRGWNLGKVDSIRYRDAGGTMGEDALLKFPIL